MSAANAKPHSSDRPDGRDRLLDSVKSNLHSIKLEAAKGTPIDTRLIKRLEREIAKLERSKARVRESL